MRGQLRLGVFNVDATPQLGSPLPDARARSVEDPLSARGIVLLGADKPIVLCVVDWIGIANSGQDAWKKALADAAGTTPDHIAVHVVHQHDGPRCDFAAAELMAQAGLAGEQFDVNFGRDVIRRTADAVREAVKNVRPVTQIGVGKAKVEKVASIRRILGPDGKVAQERYSSCNDPELIAEPEGLIDPWLRMVSFWDGEKPVAALMYYATHPQSYYGQGDMTTDFPGLARARREKELPGVLHVYFTGAGGNLAAGKYNRGTPESRRELTDRMAAAMKAAWEATKKSPITASDVDWRTEGFKFIASPYLDEAKLQAKLANPKEDVYFRADAASRLVWLKRCQSGHLTDLSCLRLGRTYILHMPGELFVEYQLAAEQMRPNDMVCLAAYGEYATQYIATEIAYEQGGYETSPDISGVSPKTEKPLLAAIGRLLK
jgi:hypothetical protein